MAYSYWRVGWKAKYENKKQDLAKDKIYTSPVNFKP